MAPLGIDTLLAQDPSSIYPGRMSPQTAAAFSLLGLLITATHFEKRVASWVMDLGIVVLCYLVLLIASGYLFGALQLFGLWAGIRVSAQTLVCIALLTSVVAARRTKYGSLSILKSAGIGGHLARTVGPVTWVLPFLLEVFRVNLTRSGVATAEYATAVATSLTAVLAFAFLLSIAWQIDGLEKQIQALFFRDDLTGLQNRKGFFLLAERAQEAARLSQAPFTVLSIDVDGLKAINDTLGHEVGSDVLRDLAHILTRTFRKSDVIGRIGGDEFVIGSQCSGAEISTASEELAAAAVELNGRHSRAYSLSFSCGHVTSQPDETGSLEELLGCADLAMYEAKRAKRKTLGLAQCQTCHNPLMRRQSNAYTEPLSN